MRILKPDEVEELERKIKETFATCPRPRRYELAPGDHSLEARELKAHFTGKRWYEVSYETLMYWRGDLSFFSAKAWVYYLQAYLIVSLRTEDSSLAMATITTLTPRADDESLRWFNRRLGLLAEAQREVLRDFVLLMWPLFYDDLNKDDDPREFWKDLVSMPGGRAMKAPEREGKLRV